MRIGLVTAVAEDPEQAALDYFEQHLALPECQYPAFRGSGSPRGCNAADQGEARATVEKMYLEELMATHDAVEGLTAFIAKRPAEWQDR